MRPAHDRVTDKRVVRLQMQIQSLNQEKVLMLQEIQKLKNEMRRPPSLVVPKGGSGGSLSDDTSLISWNRLIDSNVRRGTMTCLYCLKYSYVKKISLAFHRWLYNFKGIYLSSFSSRQQTTYGNTDYSSIDGKFDEYGNGEESDRFENPDFASTTHKDDQFLIDQELEMRRNVILNNAFKLLRIDVSHNDSSNTSKYSSGRKSPVGSSEITVPSPQTLFNSSFNGYSHGHGVARNIQFNDANSSSSNKRIDYSSQNGQNNSRRVGGEQPTSSYKNPTHSFKKKINKDGPSPKSWLRDGMANGFFTSNDIQGPLKVWSTSKIHTKNSGPGQFSHGPKAGGSRSSAPPPSKQRPSKGSDPRMLRKIDPAQLRLFRGDDDTKSAKQIKSRWQQGGINY